MEYDLLGKLLAYADFDRMYNDAESWRRLII